MKVVVPLAEGFEEIEFVTIVDILRRAEVEVVAASLGERKGDGEEKEREMEMETVEGSHGIGVVPDAAIDEIDPDQFDAIVLPGGFPGFVHLGEDERVLDLVRRMNGAGKFVAAICGAPSVLIRAGVVEGRHATVHPAGRGDLTDDQYVDDRVVVSGKLVTSKAAGTAMEFALRLVGEFIGEERMRRLAEEILAECEV
ncbi:DJ-1 family glyoxalase III [Methanocrinis sp.]|uniref:DJ-1 family glyoxalase III n=1 Tax=Methanocrinis sp. TaxID=3101522 RepID=UPI003D0E070C